MLRSSTRCVSSASPPSVAFSVAFARYPAHVHHRRSESLRLITEPPDHTRPIPSLRSPASAPDARCVSSTGTDAPSSTSRIDLAIS